MKTTRGWLNLGLILAFVFWGAVVPVSASGPAGQGRYFFPPVLENPKDAIQAVLRVGINGGVCAYATIQAAVDAAPSGATLQVASGTFAELVSITGKDLTIVGGYDATCRTLTPGASSTVNGDVDGDGDGDGTVFTITGNTVTLRNFKITGGANMAGGGVVVTGTNPQVTLDHTDIYGNQAFGGGAIFIGAGKLTFSNGAVYNNTAAGHGGGAYVAGGMLEFTESWNIHHNSAGNSGGAVAVVESGDAKFDATSGQSYLAKNHADENGGAIYISNTATVPLYARSRYLLEITDNDASGNGGAAAADAGGMFDVYGQVVFRGNQTPEGDGGAFHLSGSSKLWLDDYVVNRPKLELNYAKNGGAIYADNSPEVECDGADFGGLAAGNYAAEAADDTGGSGGAIYLNNSTFDGDDCNFSGNRADKDGGAIAAYASVVNIHVSFLSSLVVESINGGTIRPDGVTIQSTGCNPFTQVCGGMYNNVADSDDNSSGDGGAIYSNGSTLTIAQITFYNNEAFRGGAIYQLGVGAAANVSNCLIHHNEVTSGWGAGIRRQSGEFNISHCTLANNIGASGFSGTATLATNNIAWGNTSGGFADTPTSYSCNIDDGTRAGLNIDPQFVAPGAGADYHLRSTSPAIDACVAGAAVDMENRTRPAGIQYDMGAYEYYIPVYLPLVRR